MIGIFRIRMNKVSYLTLHLHLNTRFNNQKLQTFIAQKCVVRLLTVNTFQQFTMLKVYAEIAIIVKVEISLLLLVSTKKENFMLKEFVKLVI